MATCTLSSCLPISYEELTILSEKLTPEELGFAIRMIAYQSHAGMGIHDEIAPSYFRIQKKRWNRISTSLEKVFKKEDDRWVYPLKNNKQINEFANVNEEKTTKTQNPVVIKQTRIKQPSLFTTRPSGPKAKISQPDPAIKKQSSLAETVFDIGITLLTDRGRTETNARACIAKLVKDYDIGFVASAINDAHRRQDQIVEPYSWIKKLLSQYPSKEIQKSHYKNNSTTKQNTMKNKIPNHPLATKDFMDISDSMAEKIRKQNAKNTNFNLEELEAQHQERMQ